MYKSYMDTDGNFTVTVDTTDPNYTKYNGEVIFYEGIQTVAHPTDETKIEIQFEYNSTIDNEDLIGMIAEKIVLSALGEWDGSEVNGRNELCSPQGTCSEREIHEENITVHQD